MTTLILVRHGQTAWNKEERFRGRADVPLSEMGVAQARATGEHIAARWPTVAVYASPQRRAAATAAAIAAHFRLTVESHPGLMDIDFGEWQGLASAEVAARWPDALRDWLTAPHRLSIPGGETLDAVRVRAAAAVVEIAARHIGQTVVLVSHAVVNRLILLSVLRLGNDRFWHLGQDTCAINVLESKDDDYTLVSLNDTCHLAGI